LSARKGLALVISLLIGFSILSAPTGISAVKTGATCLKVGQTTLLSGKKYTCVKVGKKLQWDKGVLAQSPKSAGSTSAQLKGHDLVISQIESQWKIWRSKKSTTFTPVKLLVQPGYNTAWGEASKHSDLLISTFNANGYSLLQEPFAVFGDTEEWLSTTGRPISCGRSVPEQALGIYCGHVQLGYGYFVLNAKQNEKFVGKSLTASQKNILNYMVAHDVAVMYELQAQYGSIIYDGTKNQIPAWIREGFVQLFAALAISDSNLQKKNYFDFLVSAKLIDSFPKTLCAKTLQNFESKDRNWGGSCASSQNFYGVELLAARHGGLDALFKFVSLYGISDDWTSAFESAFGITRKDFYTEWYEYLSIRKSDRPALTPAAIPSHN